MNEDKENVEEEIKKVVNEKSYTGFVCYKILSLRMNIIVLFKLIHFHSYNLLFLTDIDGKVYICNIESEEIIFHYETNIKKIGVDDNYKHFILVKDNANNNQSLIYFLPDCTKVFVISLEKCDEKNIKANLSSFHKIKYKSDNEELCKDREMILKLSSIYDILGANIQSQLINLDFGICMSFNKYIHIYFTQ